MDWKIFLDKKVKIRLTDGFMKFGTVREVGENEIRLELDDGRTTFLNFNIIELVEERL